MGCFGAAPNQELQVRVSTQKVHPATCVWWEGRGEEPGLGAGGVGGRVHGGRGRGGVRACFWLSVLVFEGKEVRTEHVLQKPSSSPLVMSWDVQPSPTAVGMCPPVGGPVHGLCGGVLLPCPCSP